MSNNTASTLNIPKSINFLSTELKSNTQELVKLKAFMLSLKTDYKHKVKGYNSILTSILEQEADIEELNAKLSKVKQKMSLLLHQLTSTSYVLNLKDSSKNPDNSRLIDLLFLFTSPTQLERQFDYSSYMSFIVKDNDFRELLEYSIVIQRNLYRSSKELFTLIKEEIVNELVIRYPFDLLFEYFGYIYNVIDYEEVIQIQMEKHNEYTDNKNTIFLDIKTLEREVNLNDCVYKRIDRNVKEITLLLNNYKALNANSNKATKSKLYKEFLQSLKDFHPIIEKNTVNKNYMTTLSINSEVITNGNAKKDGDYYYNNDLGGFKGKRIKNSKQNSIYSNTSFKTSSNKQFLSSFADILPDQPEMELSKIITMIKGGKSLLEDKTRNTNHCSTIESQRELLDDEDFTGRPIEYNGNEYKESICDELSTSPNNICSIKISHIKNNSNSYVKPSREALLKAKMGITMTKTLM